MSYGKRQQNNFHHSNVDYYNTDLPNAFEEIYQVLQPKIEPLNEQQILEQEKLRIDKQKRECYLELIKIKDKIKLFNDGQGNLLRYSRFGSKKKILQLIKLYETKLSYDNKNKTEFDEVHHILQALSADLCILENNIQCKGQKLDLLQKTRRVARDEKAHQTKMELFMCRLDREGDEIEFAPPKHDMIVEEEAEARTITSLYAANVEEDWENLAQLLEMAKKECVDLVIMTNVLGNPLSKEEQSAYRHAYNNVYEAFEQDSTFSDFQQYIDSFEHDPSADIVTVSAKKILKLIEYGKSVYANKIEEFKRVFENYDQHLVIVPGPYENVDVIREIDEQIASHYLSVSTVSVNGINVLGVGGQVVLQDTCPLYFQNRDYFEGTEQANEELRDILLSGIDVFVSFTPIRFFTDNAFEEQNVRQYLNNYLPGKVILTSQAIQEDIHSAIKTATDAELIKGGALGRNEGNENGFFWKLVIDKKGLVEKKLYELDYSFHH